jgi:hypothetical protein
MNYGELIFAVGLVTVTSLVTYAGFNRLRPHNARSVPEAVRALLYWAGVFALFFAANLALGVIVIFLLRGITQRFFALYGLENFLLLILSAAQAFVFQAWWRRD